MLPGLQGFLADCLGEPANATTTPASPELLGAGKSVPRQHVELAKREAERAAGGARLGPRGPVYRSMLFYTHARCNGFSVSSVAHTSATKSVSFCVLLVRLTGAECARIGRVRFFLSIPLTAPHGALGPTAGAAGALQVAVCDVFVPTADAQDATGEGMYVVTGGSGEVQGVPLTSVQRTLVCGEPLVRNLVDKDDLGKVFLNVHGRMPSA